MEINANKINVGIKEFKHWKSVRVIKNCKQLKSFLGLANYYQKFTSKYAESTVPLLKLLNKGIKWKWTCLLYTS